MTEELQEQLHKAIVDYISHIGIDEFKKTSFFLSAWRE